MAILRVTLRVIPCSTVGHAASLHSKLSSLTTLDVSFNQLRGLGKVLAALQRLRRLRELNLQVREGLLVSNWVEP